MNLSIQARQGFPSLGKSDLLLLLFLLGGGELFQHLEELLLRFVELVRKKGDLLPATLGRMEKTRL